MFQPRTICTQAVHGERHPAVRKSCTGGAQEGKTRRTSGTQETPSKSHTSCARDLTHERRTTLLPKGPAPVAHKRRRTSRVQDLLHMIFGLTHLTMKQSTRISSNSSSNSSNSSSSSSSSSSSGSSTVDDLNLAPPWAPNKKNNKYDFDA
jgi:hypothetical protein